MKVLKFAFVFVIVAMVLAACAPAVAGLVALPEEARLLILALITAGLTWLLVQLGTLLKLDLGGYAAPLAAVLAPIIITFLESWLKLIPAVFDNLVLSIIHILVLLLSGSIGAYVAASRIKHGQVKRLIA